MQCFFPDPPACPKLPDVPLSSICYQVMSFANDNLGLRMGPL